MNVAVIGASNKPDRYSYQALMLLREKGHTTFPVHPTLTAIEGIPVAASLRLVTAPLDVVTLYLAPTNQQKLADEILEIRPRRVIFNPGTENPPLREQFHSAGIDTLEACTLVLLRTGQFDF